MEHDSTLYVGLDVHKDSITIAYALGMGEVELLGKIGTSKADIDRLCKRLQSKARHIRIVYEAGPCGYGLYRQLAGKGFECMVCAPSLIPKKPGERVKTDRRDAVKLVRSLRAGDLSAVYVPSVEDEAFRDLSRAWVSAKNDLKRARQRLKAFLLSHGVRYTGKADWGPAHQRWLSAFAFGSVWQQLAFEEYRRTIEDRIAQCSRLEAALRDAMVNWRFYPAVLGLQTMRGIDFTTAVGMLAELGDLSRFTHPRQLMAWLGVTPTEHSSGEKRRQGSITKNGNSYARKLLVEAAWSYRHPARVSPQIQRRHEGIPKAIVDRSWDAQVRLCRRYRRLAARGKNPNIAVVAVARELSGFIWDISRLAMALAVPNEAPTM
ncbi:IS110 family transposase [Cupriavidus necator]|uniref:IS110 family transposase n=1 Tax=Cupriavidus necator TaxID=106590 RepID=A0A1U9V2K7_CUPNE|nr:IS110 family transposase [Cupriavidus necator]AQV92618.1 IS110 family transposase [Cupriavidus necator]AQV92948.1 IS110 family transposase [Cupriavidus necator]AQV93024.1 IS110 family transposase [Cupriavidus necator]AQV98711.1 IS110 family transposase [Cupriavidus necator]